MSTTYPDGKTAIAIVTPDVVRVACSNTIPALDAPATDIKRPGQCYVLGCFDKVLRAADGSARVIDHKRFGSVHACADHDPKGRDRF